MGRMSLPAARLDGGQETPGLRPLILLGGKGVRHPAAAGEF